MLNKKNKLIKFSSAINNALDMAMAKNENVILFGLGAEDPKRVFGTLKNLKEKYKDRVFDIPTSENAITGIALGASINGLRPVLSHQRVEFSLLSLEQIINQISKWSFMNNGKKKCITGNKIGYRTRVGTRSATFAKFRKHLCACTRIKSCFAFKPQRCKRYANFQYRGQKSCNIF